MNNKIVTFSFDDGVELDERLVNLLNKYNLKCTFNISTGLVSKEFHKLISGEPSYRFVSFDRMNEIYKGHEIAAHGFNHLDMSKLSENEVFSEIKTDLDNLQRLFPSCKIQGLAYAYGNYNETVIKVVKELGLKWARAVKSTYTFDVDNLFSYSPTIHTSELDKFDEVIDRFLNLKTDKVQILYIWGHSYEFDMFNSWDKFEEICKKISNKKDIDYLTNSDAFDRLTN